MMTELRLSGNDLVLPLFVTEERDEPVAIPSMPEQFRWPVERLVEKIIEWRSLGLRAFALFPHLDASKKKANQW